MEITEIKALMLRKLQEIRNEGVEPESLAAACFAHGVALGATLGVPKELMRQQLEICYDHIIQELLEQTRKEAH